MTFIIDAYTLNVIDFSESSEPVSAEWYAWENEKIALKQFVYGVLRKWTLRCVEVNVAWSNSVAKYLQDKMRVGEKVLLSVSEGSMHQVLSVYVYIRSLEINYGRGSTASKFTRRFTIMLQEAST